MGRFRRWAPPSRLIAGATWACTGRRRSARGVERRSANQVAAAFTGNRWLTLRSPCYSVGVGELPSGKREMARIGLIQTAGIGDIVIALPIAKAFAARG